MITYQFHVDKTRRLLRLYKSLSIWAFPSRFTPILQHVADRSHAAKSLCRVSACIAAVFYSMLGSNASIVVDGDLLRWLRLVWVAHNKLHLADPTECRAEAWNHGYSALPTMLMHVRAHATIFYAHCYCSVSTFHCQSRYGAKHLYFSVVYASAE